jgi:hypothetical protein
VTFKSLLVKTADTNPAVPDPSGANWNLYFNLNGSWHLLNNWVPKLTTHVHNNERFVINRTVTIFVPHGSGIWLEVQGRECDEPAGTVILGNFANLLYPCPANKDEQNPDLLQVFSNDDTGTILDRYKSPAAAAGPHTSTSKAIVRWPHSRRVGFGNEPQGQGAYELTYLVHHLGRGS